MKIFLLCRGGSKAKHLFLRLHDIFNFWFSLKGKRKIKLVKPLIFL